VCVLGAHLPRAFAARICRAHFLAAFRRVMAYKA
jgi:hypothetical protein